MPNFIWAFADGARARQMPKRAAKRTVVLCMVRRGRSRCRVDCGKAVNWTARAPICSKLIADIEVKCARRAVERLINDRNTVIHPDRPDWQIQPDAETDVRIHIAGAEIKGVRIDVTQIAENRTTNTGND